MPTRNLLRGGRKPGGQHKFPGLVGPKRPRPAHGRQGHGPENVCKMLLPAGYPLPLHAHASSDERRLVPFQQKQIGPPGIVPAGRFEHLVGFGGVNKSLGREVGAGEETGCRACCQSAGSAMR